jgi:hypothetical protein
MHVLVISATHAAITKYTFMVVPCVVEVACIYKYLAAGISNIKSTLLLYIAMYLDTYVGIFC